MTTQDDTAAPSPATPDDTVAWGRRVGLGCFTFFVGGWSGGMVAVLLGKLIEGARKSPSCDGLPTCNWYVYAGIGAVLGALSLPILVLRRLRQRTETRG